MKNILVAAVVLATVYGCIFGPKLHDPLQPPRNQTNAVPEQSVDVSTVAEAVVSNINVVVDPKAAERAAMLASLGFGTNGGHEVKVNFTVSQ